VFKDSQHHKNDNTQPKQDNRKLQTLPLFDR